MQELLNAPVTYGGLILILAVSLALVSIVYVIENRRAKRRDEEDL